MRVIRRPTPRPKTGFFSRLSMTNLIIFINVVFFIAAYVIIFINPSFLDFIAINPKSFIEKFYFWTPITSMFMHGGFAHLFVNMFSLLFIGNFVEKLIGRKRFFWFYLISGIFSGLLFVFSSALLGDSFFFGTGYAVSGVGASGALFGIAGLLMILTPELPLYVMFIPIPIKAKYAIPGLLLLIAVISAAASWPVGNMAHFGGLLAGVIYGLYLRNKYKRKARAIRFYFR